MLKKQERSEAKKGVATIQPFKTGLTKPVGHPCHPQRVQLPLSATNYSREKGK